MGVNNNKSGISVAIIDTPKTCSDCPFLLGTFCTYMDINFMSKDNYWWATIEGDRVAAIDVKRYEHCTLTDF